MHSGNSTEIELSGYQVNRLYDVGVAGIHRLLRNRKVIDEADVVIAVAGMDGAMPGVVVCKLFLTVSSSAIDDHLS